MWVVDSRVCTLEQSRQAGEKSQGLRVEGGSRVGRSILAEKLRCAPGQDSPLALLD